MREGKCGSSGERTNVHVNDAVDKLMAAFPGTKIVIAITPLPPAPPLSILARDRGIVRRTISTCANCDLRPNCSQPVPFESPTTSTFPKAVVVGEAPGTDEDRRTRPFVGRSGKLLRAMLGKAKIHPDSLSYCNTVSCAPLVPVGKAFTVQAPTEAQMLACRTNLLAQIVIARTPYILLVGGVALKAFRGDLKMSEVHGKVFVWDGLYVVMPIFHPAAILRDRTLKTPTELDLERFYYLIEGEVEPYAMVSDRCVRCGDFGDNMDPDGVAYCDRHWGRYGGVYLKQREKWEVKVAGGEQGSML